jgi:hypothetical protein
MKNLFGLINLIAGILSLLIGHGIFVSLAQHPQNTAAGLFAFSIAAACLWLAKESTIERVELLS